MGLLCVVLVDLSGSLELPELSCCLVHPSSVVKANKKMRNIEQDTPRPPVPPFTRESAIEKVRLAENAWNTRQPEKVAMAYTVDSWWRNRAEFIQGRPEIIGFLR